MEARPKKQTVARSGFAPFSRSVAFGLEKHLLVGYGVTGKRPVYSFSLPVFLHNKHLSVPKHKLRVSFVSGGPVEEFIPSGHARVHRD